MNLKAKNAQLGAMSYYEASVQRPAAQPRLEGKTSADCVVVGAGFAGLSAAIELAKRGMKVVVLEAQRICQGPSGRNGGQVIAGFACGQGELEAQLGMSDARRMWDMSLASIALVRERIAEFDIACDDVWQYMTVADSPRKARALAAEADHMRQHYGFDMALHSGSAVQNLIATERYVAALQDPISGHLHPLKYGLGLARAAQQLGVEIFEHSAVTALQRGTKVVAHTAQGQVHADFAVLAGNCALAWEGPQVAPRITPRIMPVGTYIIGTEALSPEQHRAILPNNSAVCDNNFVLDYFRFSADHRMLFGGRVSYTTATPLRLQDIMRQRMAKIFPQLQAAKVEHVWGGFVDISMNRAPDFGRLDPNVYYLQGFSGHGVAATGLAGQLAAKAIAGQAEQFDLFARLKHHNFPGGEALRVPLLVLGTLYHRLRDWV